MFLKISKLFFKSKIKNGNFFMDFLIFMNFLSLVNCYNYNYPEFSKPYCARRYQNGLESCCKSRNDQCSVPILSTLCYCDEFCNSLQNSDCCPDYKSHCIKKKPHLAPAPIVSCQRNKIYFKPGQVIRENCNTCKCDSQGKVNCERNICLTDLRTIADINRYYQLGWTSRNYSEFWGKTLKEGIKLRLGTFEPVRRVRAMSQLSNKGAYIPHSFNAIKDFPGLISRVRDQGWCGSSWAISTISVASDRFSITSKGQELVELAPQHLLSCVKNHNGCHGGHLDKAWNYFRTTGVADEQCYPYSASVKTCRVRKKDDDLRTLRCRLPTKVKRTNFYKMGPAYALKTEHDIKHEIYNYGPVQATMQVYHDFFSYDGGVYRRSSFGSNKLSGFHSVRLVGWGEHHDGYRLVKFWIAANSWGTWWGDNGYFRILRGVNECGIEDYVLASLPQLHHKKILRNKRQRKRNIKSVKTLNEIN